ALYLITWPNDKYQCKTIAYVCYRLILCYKGNAGVTKAPDSMVKAPPPPEFSTRRGTGAVVLAGVDGRSLMARRFREIVTGVENDLGGDLTEAQKHLLARAATLAVWAEERETELATGGDFDAVQY